MSIESQKLKLTGALQIKRGTAAALELVNYKPADGELVVETDTKKMKLGDGVKAWKDLEYMQSSLTEKEINEAVRESLENLLAEIKTIDCGEL